MHFNALFMLAAALTVAAAPAPTKYYVKKPVERIRQPNIRDLASALGSIDFDQCTSCLEGVGSTIEACGPLVDGDFLTSFQCASSVVKDFNIFQNDCTPCLQSIANAI